MRQVVVAVNWSMMPIGEHRQLALRGARVETRLAFDRMGGALQRLFKTSVETLGLASAMAAGAIVATAVRGFP
jgi:hypothetical protein